MSSLRPTRIPTLLGIFLLLAGLFGGIFLVNTKDLGFLPRASPQTQPKNIKITNVTDTSFTVSWVTDTQTIGFVKTGTSQTTLPTTVADDRDQINGGASAYRTHHVTVRLLQPATTYYFSIGTGAKELYTNNGTPYEVTTTGVVTSSAKTLYGTVLAADGSPVSGALVYISSNTLSPLSVLTQSSGSFVLTLASARDATTGQAFSFTDTTPLELFAVSPIDQTTSLVKGTIATAQPFPDITLGQNMDAVTLLSTPEPIAAAQATNQTVQSKFSTQLLANATETEDSVGTLLIHSPENNTSIGPSQKFSGSGPKSTSATVTFIGPTTMSETINITATGNWEYSLKKTLLPGSYTFRISATAKSQTQTATLSLIQPNSAATTATPKPTLSPSNSTSSATQVATPISGSSQEIVFLSMIGILFLASGLFFHFSRL